MVDDPMKDKLILKRFGRYLLLDHLVDGGMAKICRARFLNPEVQRIDAIKMVQSQFSKDPAFKQMFMDEIKVSFGLNHPNIAKIHDYGLFQEQLFCAMEYVDGKNLKQILDRLRPFGYVFPTSISLHIISQACQALSYAHNFVDSLSGQKCNIIHRDISPHNIMITYEGAVKVIDFGIAKASTNTEATQAGTIKGKMPYLAPEYLDGIELDHRYDQFAIGLTLWELLCGRKHFSAKNDLAILKMIQECKIVPPSSINPNVPKELDTIILKSLSKDRNNRYANMDEFNRALVKFLYGNYPDFNATDLSKFAKKLFAEEIRKDRDKFVEFGRIDIRPFLEELKHGDSSPSNSGAPAQAKNDSLPLTPADELATKQTVAHRASDFDFGYEVDKRGKIVSKDGKKDDLKVEKTASVSRSALKKEMAKEETKINERKVDLKQIVAEERKRKLIKLVGTIAAAVVVIFFAWDPVIKMVTPFIEGTRVPASAKIKGETKNDKVEKKTQYLTLIKLPPLAKVIIDGKEYAYSGVGIELEINKTYKLRIEQEGHLPYEKDVFISPETATMETIPELNHAIFGELATSANFYPGQLLRLNIGSARREIRLPIRDESVRLPVGKYQAKIFNPEFQTDRSIEFEIEEDKRVILE